MKVLILGTDIDAFLSAITCRREGLEVVVLGCDQAEGIDTGVQIPPNGTYILDHLDLLDAALDKADIIESIDFRRYSDGRMIRAMPYGEEVCRAYGGAWVTIYREDFLRILREMARSLGVSIHNAAVREVLCETAEVTLGDGERVQGDVVIGADGIDSQVRDAVIQSSRSLDTTDEDQSNTASEVVYHATISRKHLKAINDSRMDELWQRKSVTAWLGPEQHAIMYPVRRDEAFNLTLYRADPKTIQESCRGWDDRLQTILSTTTNTPSISTPTPPPSLPSWTLHRAALFGTTARQIPPHQAQETATTIEDAAVLGTLLGLLNRHAATPHQLRSSIPEVLRLYEDLRRPAAERNIQSAVDSRRMFQLGNGVTQQLRDWILGGGGITRDTDGWLRVVSSRQGGVLGGGRELVGETNQVFDEWRRLRLPAASRATGTCGIGGLRRKWYAGW
ncbi:FAD/NAD(P)-binding domain-containing protein [Aspergillus ellipticus CBS 707.79]|uniref:FAD/NAD(P)-binding domain-containing protein n=1 Tax=Aspergillus ellipticus CBS 707.79 TaxID=1448320 RepID=A0A319CWZ0_9EURO|nr:FAD/NAD(P)-binding domain-containing protein [Aspergillus ellipticus CBS 707.79]